MTVTVILVIIGCFVLGYWLASVFLPHALKRPDSPQSDPEGPSVERTAHESSPRHWADILKVSRDATREQVTAAYKQAISRYHPDKVSNMGEEIRDLAQQRSTEINSAYKQALHEFGA